MTMNIEFLSIEFLSHADKRLRLAMSKMIRRRVE